MNPINLKKEQVLKEINLRKEVLNVISLKKKELVNLKARIVLAMDMSGSMDSEYNSGRVQNLIERILPLAMKFDDDGVLELVVFDDNAKFLDGVSIDNIYNFVDEYVKPKCTWGGTNYAPVINLISNKVLFDYKPKNNKPAVSKDTQPLEEVLESPTFFKKHFPTFSKVFSKRKEQIKIITNNITTAIENLHNEFDHDTRNIYDSYEEYKSNKGQDDIPLYVLFITDGSNFDRSSTDMAIIKSSHLPIFWQFVGIGNSSFEYLEELDTMKGRYIDNANFINLTDISNMSDSELYDMLLNEFPSWLTLAKDNCILG